MKDETNVSEYGRKDYFDRWIIRKRNRIVRRNKNWLCIIVGETGSGKSYLGGRICELIDPTFLPTIIEKGIKSRVAIGDAAELNEILRSGNLKRGDMVLFDEAGVAIGSRDWYTEMNKVTMYILQTFRHMNIGVIFTVPDMTFVDVQARKLFHSYLECLSIDFLTNKVTVKPFELQSNPYEGKVYRKYPRFDSKRINRFHVLKPPKEFIDLYEPIKEELSAKLGERLDVVKGRLENKEKQKKTDMELMKIIKEDFKTFTNVSGDLDAYTMQFRLGIGKDRAYRLIANYHKFSPNL